MLQQHTVQKQLMGPRNSCAPQNSVTASLGGQDTQTQQSTHPDKLISRMAVWSACTDLIHYETQLIDSSQSGNMHLC